MSGGLIALTVEECSEILLWADWTRVHRVLGLNKSEQELVERLNEWRTRHTTEVHVRGD